jgi:hypothetical protein
LHFLVPKTKPIQIPINKLDEDNFKHKLEVFYKKNADFTYSVVTKSALESNMFSGQRVTLEGMIRANNPTKQSISDNMFQVNGSQTQRKLPNKKKVDVIAMLQEHNISDFHKRDLGEPTGRREVELLNEWLDKMLNEYVFSKGNIRKDADNRKEALYHAKLILSICLRDLIRQVSVMCLERGVLIEKVLNNYINIFETETRGNMYDLDELQTKHLTDILKMKADTAHNNNLAAQSKEADSEDQFTKYNKISELEGELEEANAEIKRLKDEIRQKERVFTNSIGEFKRRECKPPSYNKLTFI